MDSCILNLLLLSALAAYTSGHSVTFSGAYDYHLKVGIPLAERIKKAEENAVISGSRSQRIVNGFLIDISEAPYQVGLINHLGSVDSVCGAVLISNTRVATAAHCKNDGSAFPERFTLVFGTNTIFSGGVRQEGNNLIVHPQWNPTTNPIAYDIGVIKINHVDFTDVIQPISLPSSSENNVDLFVGQIALATGWGQNHNGQIIPQSQDLSGVFMYVISNQECEKVYGSYVQSSTLCTIGAEKESICNGDFGGPLAVQIGTRKVLVGISSFASPSGCESGQASAFARVSSYVSWILSI